MHLTKSAKAHMLKSLEYTLSSLRQTVAARKASYGNALRAYRQERTWLAEAERELETAQQAMREIKAVKTTDDPALDQFREPDASKEA